MASRRISQSAINWAAIAERVPPNQKTNFTAFKGRSDKYLRSVLANPEQVPKIDWAYYKKRIANPAFVDQFQKQYEAVKVPYPADTMSSQVDAQTKEVQSQIEQFKGASSARIADFQKEINQTKALLPFDQMTLEDYRDAYPDQALDPLNKPTFWPHNAEEQLDYKKDNKPAAH